MSIRVGAFLLFMLSLNVADASPVLLVNKDGTLNTTYVPYTVLAGLGYGVAALAGAGVLNLWSPVLENDKLKTTPDQQIAKKNRVIMSEWLRKNIGNPGNSPALESLRDTVGPLVPNRRNELTQPIKQAIPVTATGWTEPAPAKGGRPNRRKIKPQVTQSKAGQKLRVRQARPRPPVAGRRKVVRVA